MFKLSFNFASLSLKASLFYTQIDFECLKYLSKLSIYLMLCLQLQFDNQRNFDHKN